MVEGDQVDASEIEYVAVEGDVRAGATDLEMRQQTAAVEHNCEGVLVELDA